MSSAQVLLLENVHSELEESKRAGRWSMPRGRRVWGQAQGCWCSREASTVSLQAVHCLLIDEN